MLKQNPFIISGYISPDFFCDREKETSRMLDAIKNHRHLTLFSPRRMGKSGLIKHSFYMLKSQRGSPYCISGYPGNDLSGGICRSLW